MKVRRVEYWNIRSRMNLDRRISLSFGKRDPNAKRWTLKLQLSNTSHCFSLSLSLSLTFKKESNKKIKKSWRLKMESGGRWEILRHLRNGWLMSIPRMVYRNGSPLRFSRFSRSKQNCRPSGITSHVTKHNRREGALTQQRNSHVVGCAVGKNP